jgi:uncharacterized membrane protein
MKITEKILSRHINFYCAAFIITFFLLAAFGIWLQVTRRIQYLDTDTFLFDNAFYNTIHGNGLFYWTPNHYNITTTYPQRSELGSHNAFIMFLVLPIYYVFQSVYTLLFVQILMMGAAAIPLYKIGQELLDEAGAKIVAIAYLIYPVIMWNTVSLHFTPYLPFFAFYTIYFYMKKRFDWFCVSLLLCLSIKENEPMLLFMFGLYFVYDAYKSRLLSDKLQIKYVLLLLLTPIYLIVSMKWIIPYFSPEGYIFVGRYSYLGTTPVEILHSIFTIDMLWRVIFYVSQLIIPASLIPIIEFPAFVMSFPFILQNVLSNSEYQTWFMSQYHFEIIVVIFMSILVFLAKIKRVNEDKYNKVKVYFMYTSIIWCIVFAILRIFMFVITEFKQ